MKKKTATGVWRLAYVCPTLFGSACWPYPTDPDFSDYWPCVPDRHLLGLWAGSVLLAVVSAMELL